MSDEMIKLIKSQRLEVRTLFHKTRFSRRRSIISHNCFNSSLVNSFFLKFFFFEKCEKMQEGTSTCRITYEHRRPKAHVKYETIMMRLQKLCQGMTLQKKLSITCHKMKVFIALISCGCCSCYTCCNLINALD